MQPVSFHCYNNILSFHIAYEKAHSIQLPVFLEARFVQPSPTYLRVTYRKKKVVWDAIYFSAHGVFLELGGWYERRADFCRVWGFDGRDVGENVWSFIYILTSCDPNACILPFSQRSFVHELDNYLCTTNK